MRKGQSQGQLAAAEHALVKCDRLGVRPAIGDGRQPHAIVIAKQITQPAEPVRIGHFHGTRRRTLFHETAEAAEHASGFAGRIFFQVAFAAVLHLEVPVDAAQLEREAVQHDIGPGVERDRVPRRHRVEFRAGREARLAQPGDEDLRERNPLSFRHHFHPVAKIRQHVGDRLHVRNRVFELRHRRGRRVHMRINEARHDRPAAQVVHRRDSRSRQRPDGAGLADGDDPSILHRKRLPDGKGVVDGDDLASDVDRVGGPRRRLGPADESAGNRRQNEAKDGPER